MRRLAALFLLSACSWVAPMTAARLATMDPLTADPAQIAVAVILPPGLAVIPGSARLQLHAARGTQTLTGDYALAQIAPDAALSVPPGASGHIFALTPGDAARMRDWQRQVADWRSAGPGEATLGLALGACAQGTGPAPGAEGAALIRLNEGGALLPLIGPAPLTAILGPDVMATIAPCAPPR